MMYSSKMVCCLKANGKVLREHKDTVYVPFGTEYSVQLKNLNSKRALVKVEIDGVDVTSGSRLVIDPNETFELTRFIKNGNLKEGNRFKFIERTASIEKHHGVGMEDGLIRIEFQYEKVFHYVPPTYEPGKVYYRDPNPPTWFGGPIGTTTHDSWSSTTYSSSTSTPQEGHGFLRSTTASAVNPSSPPTQITPLSVNDAGITVPGSISDQEFRQINNFPVEDEKFVMVLKLLGETEAGKLVTAPVTVKTKPKCITCGRVNKSGAKFCTECGTALEIV